MRILIADDEMMSRKLLQKTLERVGYEVTAVENGRLAAEHLCPADGPRLALLDWVMPELDGPGVCREVRKRKEQSYVYMVLLTSKESKEDVVAGLESGADDYLTKPFELTELLARLRALVRRGHQVKNPILKVHDLEIDTAARTVKRSGKSIHLTPREYALLQFLAFHRGKVVSRSMIWEHLYDEHDENTSNVVDVYIRYLRTKIDKGFEPALILTRWGEGYLLRGETE
jgi:DNA-binding response OmpR family regulator